MAMRFTAFVFLSALLHGDFWEQGHPHQAVEIFAGVTYGCERLAVTQEGVVTFFPAHLETLLEQNKEAKGKEEQL